MKILALALAALLTLAFVGCGCDCDCNDTNCTTEVNGTDAASVPTAPEANETK